MRNHLLDLPICTTCNRRVLMGVWCSSCTYRKQEIERFSKLYEGALMGVLFLYPITNKMSVIFLENCESPLFQMPCKTVVKVEKKEECAQALHLHVTRVSDSTQFIIHITKPGPWSYLEKVEQVQ